MENSRPAPVLPRSARRPLLGVTALLLGGLAVLGGYQTGPSAVADPAKPGVPTGFECRWTDTPPAIDGKADERAWRQAQTIDRFSQPWLGKAARPVRTPTKARLLWDREYLYFAAEMEDGDLFADVKEHDGPAWQNDVFELFFKPTEKHGGYYEFEVTAANTVLDIFFPRDERGKERYFKDGDFHLESRVQLRGTLNQRTDRDKGWTVEGRIPWVDFLRTGGRPAIGEQWKFALCRYDYDARQPKPELSTSAPLTQSSFHRYQDYSPLTFVGPEKKTARPFGVEKFQPVTTSRVVGSPDPPLPYRTQRIYPRLKLPAAPVIAYSVPGTDQMLGITQEWPGPTSKLVRFRDDANVEQFETLLTVDRTVYDLTFHPKFAQNGWVYICGKGPHSAKPEEKKMRISRYTFSRTAPYTLDPKSEVPIIEWLSDGHDGGSMVFDKDGLFYVTTGDGTSDSDTHVVGQDTKRLTAKLLRLDLEHPDPGRHYSVPKDNPFVGKPEWAPETWALGFRNPWRMTIDQKTGHIWVGNNGQDLLEQAFLIEKGANYGWSVYEGSQPFYATRKLAPVPHTKPTVEHPHSEARSLTGGIVYYGRKYPELQGAYVYGDYSTGKIWAVKHDGKKILWHKEIADTALQITGFGTDRSGEIVITDYKGGGEGGFFTLVPTPKGLPPSNFPLRLSESGLFRSVKGHQVDPGLIPYSVNAPLWSDGAYKERYIALPTADAKIEMTPTRGWNLPEKTVLVKSFALETKEGDPRSRRWIETRFLTKQDGEWVGYSYRWNEEQTDATLVSAKGEDQTFEVRVPRSAENPDGTRRQLWHYPSRAECMVCHSRAANYVLGLSTLQMNKEHDYGSVRDNQLRTLEHLGLLKFNYTEDAQNALRARLRAKGLSEAKVNEYVSRYGASHGQRPVAAQTWLAQTPESLPKLADPYDPKAGLDARARSYIHSNCSQCHVEAGGGNAQMELEFTTPLDRMRVRDAKPVHDTFNLPDPRLIAPGRPESSVLLHRISHREKGHMPPLATVRPDREAIQLIRDWIRQMPAANPK